MEKNINLSKKKKNSFREIFSRYKYGYLFILPFSIVFFTFTVFPVIIAIYFGFTYYNVIQPPNFIGWDNYVKLFFRDEIFKTALGNTFLFGIVIGFAGYVLSLMVAWFINDLSPKLRAVLTLLFYAPALTGAASIWIIILSGDRYGYLNSILLSLGIIDTPVQWLISADTIKICVIVVALWSSLGVNFLSLIAGFQNIDRSLIEAGAVDGIKNRYQELWFITLPSMKGQLLFSAVMSITSSFGIGDIITALCGFPSSGYEAHTIMNHLVDYGTIRYEMGYACAIATVLFLIMVGTNTFVKKLLEKVGS